MTAEKYEHGWINDLYAERDRLLKVLTDLIADLEDRAEWMRFQPSKDRLVVPCGSGVYRRAKNVLDAHGPAKEPTS